MPIQAPQWTEFLSCPICCHEFDGDQRGPISLGCGHTVCKGCLSKLQRNQCPYDQTVMRLELDQLPVNGALLSLVNTNGSSNGSHSSNSQGHDGKGDQSTPPQPPPAVSPDKAPHYFTSIQCIKELALLLKPFSGSGINGSTSVLSRPMQRKLVTLINCQLVEEEGRARSVRAARSLGERTVTELILHHQNHHQLSANLWAAVRSRGCQFLGPAMQEEVLKLVLLALEDGSALSRKVLVMFVVQRLEPHFPQASKTSIGHVVQLLYRASCFKVSKREGDSSLMQLKEEFRTYEALRREHDAQIVQIATEAGLRIAPDQWSSLLYGDTAHKSHMQSIIDKLQTPQSFGQSVQELVIALQRTGDPGQLSSLRPQLELLAGLDPSPDSLIPGWELCASAMEAIKSVVIGLVKFIQHHGNKKITDAHHAHNAKYKTSMCRDLTQRGGCPRGNDCTFAHSDEELEKFRSRSRKQGKASVNVSSSSVTPNNKTSSNQQKQNSETPHTSIPNNKAVSNSHSSQRSQPEHKKLSQSQINLNHQTQPSTQTSAPSQTHHNKIPSQQSSIVPNHVRQTPQPGPHQIQPSELVRPMMKNGERPPAMPLMGKHLVMEEVMQTGGLAVPHSQFEPTSFMQVTPHSQPVPIITAPPGNLIRQSLAPPPPPTPVYATPIPEYAYGAFHPQGTIFAAGPHSSMSLSAGVPTAMHPSPGGQHTPVYSQHPTTMLPEMFSPNPQTLLVNQGQLYNLVSTARDFSTPVAETRQTNSIAKSVISSWPEITSDHFSMAQNEINFTTSTISSTASYGDSPSSEVFASKSLTELKERKEEILSQLENIVGKEAIDEVAIQVAKGEPVSTTSSSIEEYPSTYSIWTSGANLTNFSFGKKSYDKPYDPAFGYRTNAEDGKHSKDDFVPFDPPVHSRFGPISRMTRPFLRPSNAIQVSACNTTEPVTTPTVHKPVPAISPMPQVLYQHPGFAVGVVSYPPNLEYMNTVGHGIIDPPHLHMSQLEPSGSRPSDPIMDFLHMGQEERQRQQFIVAKEGIDAFCFNQKIEEMRLKEELNLVVQGIQEKKKEIEQDRDNMEPNNEEDLTDFEKNWNFDFDECEKE